MGKLDGRAAMVTGAAQGIGKGIAIEYAKAGADVALMDLNGARLQETAKELEVLGHRVITYEGDVAEEEAIIAFTNLILDKYGRIDILAHAAGIQRVSTITELDTREWDTVMGVNLRSSFLFCKYVGQKMKEQGSGAIVLIESCSSKTGEANNGAYCASKAGVRLLANSFALEVAEYGVRVNSVAPSAIDSELFQRFIRSQASLKGITKEESLNEYNQGTPLRRIGEPEEVGKLCVFLSSDDAAFITGSSFNISGGRECH